MTKLHEVYKARCEALNMNPFSIKKFTEYFKDNNFSLFKRKKDVCNKCMAYDEGNISVADFADHQKLRKDALDLKDLDKSKADNVSNMVITADTEALLLAPLSEASIMFFHSKLNVHNFTFFDLLTRDVENYVWSENNGDIKASNFTTCYIDFLSKAIEQYPSLSNITLWSDSCGAQNKCNVLSNVSNALLTFAVEHNITIFHKYLEVGHTHMESDSVHATIEKAKKGKKVNLTSDYVGIIQSARKRPKKYGVKYVDFTFFKDFKLICDIKSINPSKDVGPPPPPPPLHKCH